MKIFAIRDETDKSRKDLAWLLYYETPKKFYIELPGGADPWETPLLLSSFARAGTTSINSYWSGLWVQQRIIPPDRQNIQQILHENGLKEYDEFGLLMLSKGRCAQDDYYLVSVTESAFADRLYRLRQLSGEGLLVLAGVYDFRHAPQGLAQDGRKSPAL